MKKEEKELVKAIDYTGITAAFWCHDGKGRFFLSQRSDRCRNDHHQWESGGSAIAFGESPDEAIARALAKELGVTEFVISERLAPVSHVYESERGKEHWIGLPHIVEVSAEDVVIQEVDMVENSGWFTLDTLPSPLDNGTTNELKQYREELEKYSV